MANCYEEHLFKFLQKMSVRQDIYFDQLNGTCPKICMCCFNGTTNTFLINCTSKRVTYPELPTHTPNKVAVLLANCGITKLPSNVFFQLKSQNVTHLDLRNNSLSSLDDKTVVSLYENTKTTIELSGNPFDCHCKAKSFLGFLKDRKPSEYSVVLTRCKIAMCPDNCVCCLDNLNSTGLNVDCRGRRLTEFPLLPGSITKLDLGNNNITEINPQWQEFLKNKIISNGLKIFLAGNPWTCTCDINDIVSFGRSISLHIQDFADMECSNLGKHLALVEESDICPSYFIYPLILLIFSLIIITALNAFVYFKQPIFMWFYEHEICMSMAVRVDLERMKKFDAFLCFTHKDEHLIADYVERLEKGQRQFRLCFYLRDWNVGASIPECIIQSVKDSRRIIILMTKNFLESTWGKLEFRLALHATSKDRCKRLIVILYPDVENFDDLDSELKAYMVLNTYLRRDSPNFWNKLLYSMPHIT
ncbi:protein toll-like [Drosophila kikkawai]|uniref:Protein toll-like n=1 Tax=Drosophila kikkawai TaxID=30033 RepID=A0ABM4GJ18_DROKI